MAIAVALLASEEGEAALAEALRLGTAYATPVQVVPLDEAAARRAAQLDGTPNVEVTETLAGTDLVDAFLERVAQLGAGMIVIGLRRRTTVGKLILGSNAQRILLDAPVPVLTVKPDSTVR